MLWVRRISVQIHINNIIGGKYADTKNLKHWISKLRSDVFKFIVVCNNPDLVEELKSLPVVLIESIWNNNFAEQRNIALEYSKNNNGDFIIWLDHDDRLNEESIEQLNNDKFHQFLIGKTEPLFCPVQIKDGVILNQARVFPVTKEIQWIGAIHEQLNIRANTRHILSSIKIIHEGYTEDNKDIKADRNLEILESEPPSFSKSYHMAKTMTIQGRSHEAERWYLDALKYPVTEDVKNEILLNLGSLASLRRDNIAGLHYFLHCGFPEAMVHSGVLMETFEKYISSWVFAGWISEKEHSDIKKQIESATKIIYLAYKNKYLNMKNDTVVVRDIENVRKFVEGKLDA